MDWFVKKEDGSSFGPIELAELRDWAAEGRIAPEDQVSTDQQNWSPSHENLDLHMDWTIDFEDGTTYGPIHLLAFADFVMEGIIGLEAGVKNIRHDISYALGEVLLPALVKSNANLRSAIDKLASAPPPQEPTKPPAPTPPPVEAAPAVNALEDDQPERTEKPSTAIKDIASERKRAERWESLYKQESEKSEKREAELNDKARDMQRQILELTTELDEVKSKLHNLEKMNSELEKIEALAENSTEDRFESLKSNYRRLLDSYNHISLQYDQLGNHFSDQSKEIDELREAKAAILATADRRTRDSLDEVQREREEADRARTKLSILEKDYKELLKSYREMNDQVIRMSQQVD